MRIRFKFLLILAIIAVSLIGIFSMDFTSINYAEDEENMVFEAATEAVPSADIAEPVKASHSSKNPQKTHRDATVNQGETPEKKEVKSSKTETKKSSEVKPNSEVKTDYQPKHTHIWKEVISERQVKRTKEVPWTKCYACGTDMTGNPSHIDKHLENHDSNVHYGTEYRTEEYYVTESYVSGYKCSCGATK